jgi:hypothetical protein
MGDQSAQRRTARRYEYPARPRTAWPSRQWRSARDAPGPDRSSSVQAAARRPRSCVCSPRAKRCRRPSGRMARCRPATGASVAQLPEPGPESVMRVPEPGCRAVADLVHSELDFLQRPRKDSNLRTRFRKPMLYPLSYGGVAQTCDPAQRRRRCRRHWSSAGVSSV